MNGDFPRIGVCRMVSLADDPSVCFYRVSLYYGPYACGVEYVSTLALAHARIEKWEDTAS